MPDSRGPEKMLGKVLLSALIFWAVVLGAVLWRSLS